MPKEKQYSIVLKGRVQDVGFRSRIISTARIYGIRGYPPINDIDGSVKLLCGGPEELINKFLRDIDIREELPSGIRVEAMEKKELPVDFPLPLRFAPVEVEELSNISRKLDTGIESLKNIEENTSTLSSMDKKLDALGALDEVNSKLDVLPAKIASALKDVFKG